MTNLCKVLDFHGIVHGEFTDKQGTQIHPHNGDTIIVCPKCTWETSMGRKWRDYGAKNA